MAWDGFNSADSLEAIVKPINSWTISSKPHTLSQIETINNGIHQQILMFLRGQGINTDNLTTDDKTALALINDLWSACLIGPAKKPTDKDGKGETWDRRYKDMLENFVKYKSKVSAAAEEDKKYSSFGLAYTTIADEDPIFSKDDVW